MSIAPASEGECIVLYCKFNRSNKAEFNMPIGNLVNGLLIIVGSVIGIVLKDKFPDKIKLMIFQMLGISTLIIGIQMTFQVKDIVIVIFSLIIGGIIGELIDIELRFERLVDRIKNRLKLSSHSFTEGFVNASLVYCVGSMAIIGSLNEGLRNDHSVLLTKAILDGALSIVFAATYGIGVLFSFISVLLYQGSITYFARLSESFFTPLLIAQLTATGGAMVACIGINLLEIKKIKVANVLPSMVVVIILTIVFVK